MRKIFVTIILFVGCLNGESLHAGSCWDLPLYKVKSENEVWITVNQDLLVDANSLYPNGGVIFKEGGISSPASVGTQCGFEPNRPLLSAHNQLNGQGLLQIPAFKKNDKLHLIGTQRPGDAGWPDLVIDQNLSTGEAAKYLPYVWCSIRAGWSFRSATVGDLNYHFTKNQKVFSISCKDSP